LTAGRAIAVESTTDIFVTKSIVIAGNPGTGPKVSLVSVPVVSRVAYAGKVTAIGAGSITDAAATWTQNQFNGTNGTHYIEFSSGASADILATVAATDTLTHPGTLVGQVNVGDTYRIRRHMTLASLFGPNNEAGLLAGQNPSQADNIQIFDPATQGTYTYFYSSVSGFTGWYRSDYTPAGSVIIDPEQGLMMRRRGNGDLLFHVSGATKTSSTLAPVLAGYNLVGTLQGNKNLKLSELNLYTGDAATGLAGGNNMSAADNLLIMSPDSTLATYFYSNFSGFEGWYNASFASANNVTIPSGSAFFINRKSTSGPFYWTIPAE
jgi:uncharacterized protein (TIGR02597 family)